MRRLFVLAASLLLTLPAVSQSVSFNTMKLGPNTGQFVGDFNGDGREDMIYLVPTNYTSFHMLVSSGTGAYYASTTYSIPGGRAGGYAVGDFNRDGKLDLAIIGVGPNQSSPAYLNIFLGEGNGTFHAPIITALPFTPSAMVAADVNHDGKMDLVMLNNPPNNQPTQIVTYLGNGSGGFTPGPTTISSAYYMYDLWVGDFDGDGKADLFSANCQPGGCIVIVYYGDGTGRFVSPVSASSWQGNFTVADVDGDGKSDIITSTMGYINSPDQPYLSVFYGAANRTLQFASIPTMGCTFGRPVVADFNGDHIPDIVFPEHPCGSGGPPTQMAFLAGHGNRSFGPEQTLFNAQDSPGGNTIVLRANNGDSKPDFFFTDFESTGSGITEEGYLMVNSTSGVFAHCNAPNSATGFRICSPASGSTVASPVKFSIGAAGPVPMRKVEVWADGVKKFEQLYAFSHYAYLDTSIALTKGTHAITIISAGWDNSLQKKSYSITVQ